MTLGKTQLGAASGRLCSQLQVGLGEDGRSTGWQSRVVRHCSWKGAQLLGQPLSQSSPPARWKTGLNPTALQCPWGSAFKRGGFACGGVIFRGLGVSPGLGGLVQGVQRWLLPLQTLRSHFWMLFLLQPPVEGGLGSANVSPQGGPL